MQTTHRLYGTIFGLAPAEATALLPLLHPCEVESDLNRGLEFSFEGVFPEDIDSFLHVLQENIPEHARGHLDFIDNDSWYLFRYAITRNNIVQESLNLDDYLDRYRHFG